MLSIQDMRMVVCFHIPTVFCTDEEITSFICCMYMIMILGRHMHTDEPLVPEPSCFEVEIAIKKLKRYKSPGID